MNSSADIMLIKGPTVYAEDRTFEKGGVLISDGTIRDVLDADAARKAAGAEVRDFPAEYHLIPGMIDTHIHGVSGADVMDAGGDALRTISAALPAEGTTSFLATTISGSVERTENALKAVQDHARAPQEAGNAELLGVHMEGPFISPRKAGAQRVDMMLAPDMDLFRKWQVFSNGAVKLITVAPELQGGIKFVHSLRKEGVVVSVGHSDAGYEVTVDAVEAGASRATHLFNAMRPFHHREPGAAGALLLREDASAEIIVDGVHLHPAAVELAFRTKGAKGLILITDSIRAKNMGDGEFELGGQNVIVTGGAARLSDGTLAGSVLKMNVALGNMLRFSGCTMEDAVRMASRNPAETIGVFDRVGGIAKDKDADLVVLDKEYNVVLTLCKGRVAYQA